MTVFQVVLHSHFFGQTHSYLVLHGWMHKTSKFCVFNHDLHLHLGCLGLHVGLYGALWCLLVDHIAAGGLSHQQM